MKFSVQKNNFRYTLKLPQNIRTPTFINKKLKLHLNSESLTQLENSETEFSLKQFLKKKIYSGNLHHLPLRKVFLAIVGNFN